MLRQLRPGPGALAGVCAWLVLSPAAGQADIRLPRILSDRMVLQQGVAAPIWGEADPSEEVAVTFRGQTHKTVADKDGRWSVRLSPLKAEPGQTGTDLVVAGKNTVTVRDVLVGEVWLGSGQSNLVWPVRSCAHAEREIPRANYPRIRLSSDTLWPSYLTAGGGWETCTSNTVRRFSALLYYFGRDLHAEMGVPVGLIARAVSGSSAGPWISNEGFIADPACLAEYQAYRERTYPGLLAAYQAARAKWEQDSAAPRAKAAARLAAIERTPHDLTLRLEGGVFFFVPPFREQELRNIEVTIKYDGTNYLPAFTATARKYNSALHTGVVQVARAGDTLKMDLKLFARADANVDAAQGAYTIEVVRKDWSCTGTYKGLFRDAETAGNVTGGVVPLKDEVVPKEPTEPPGRDFPGSPGCGEYYTRFIAPVVPFAIRGAIWDQGESGTGLKDISLPTLVSAMVGSWRKAWGADFPFFFVQKPSGGGWNWLPGRTDDKGQPVPRPALPASPQQVFKLEQTPGRLAFHDMERIPNSDMAIAMDLNDGLHPFDKIPYAQRIYRLALARAYGRPVEGRGPTLQSHAIEGERVRLVFKHVGAGLEARGGEPLQGFMIAGEGRVFHWAEAQIEGDAVLVSSPAVPQPAAVRYAWAESPSWANLFNKDGVPALPFRTDDWKGPVPAPRPASLVVTNATATPPPR